VIAGLLKRRWFVAFTHGVWGVILGEVLVNVTLNVTDAMTPASEGGTSASLWTTMKPYALNVSLAAAALVYFAYWPIAAVLCAVGLRLTPDRRRRAGRGAE
jgi:hypothetical protein